VSKNWSNDSRIDSKPPSNLLELIEKDLNFEEELEKFECSFEWDELLDIQNESRIYLILMFFTFLEK